MQFKLFVITLLGACVFQVTFADSASEDADEKFINDATDKAKETINKVASLIKDKVDHALVTLNTLKDQVSIQLNPATKIVKEKLLVVFAQANATIKKITDKATKLGINILECVSHNKEHLQTLLETLLADEVSCVTNEFNTALKSISGSITATLNGVNAVTNFPNRLAECKNSIGCITQVIVEVGMIELEVPAQITKSIAEITILVGGIQIRLEICAAVQLVKAGIEIAKVVFDVTKCAINKGIK